MRDPDSLQKLSAAVRAWWRQPPRRHGEIIEGRSVGYLELFYDLVFVVLVARAAHVLAADISWPGVARYAVLFTLLIMAWQNGSMFHDLHSREDGRGRNVIFTQMALLVVLSAFAPTAFEGDGPAFALTFAALLALDAYQWWTVRKIDDPKYHRTTGQYLASLLATIAAMVASAFVGEEARWWLWVAVALISSVGTSLWMVTRPADHVAAFYVTESLAERYALFVIIVLGEAVAGVANGLLAAELRTPLTFVTALACLLVAFGLWWSYFDSTHGQPPRRQVAAYGAWIFWHLPLTAAIAGTGAGLVALIEHADAGPAPEASVLVGAAGAVVLVSTALITWTLDDGRTSQLRSLMAGAAFVAAACSAGLGLAALEPWLSALVLAAIPMALWLYIFVVKALRTPAPTATGAAASG